MYLGDTTLTGGEVAEQMSRYIQAFEALGAGTGTARRAARAQPARGAASSSAPGQTQGYRRTSLHPLGSADDHAYVINDAGITILIIDPYFTERALALLEKCPGLTQVLTIGPVPEELAPRRHRPGGRGRASSTPLPLVAKLAAARPHRVDHLHRRHDRQAQGRHRHVAAMSTMTQIQLAEWEWPENPRFLMCTPLSHAGAAFFVPTVIKGGTLYVLSSFNPAEVLRTIEEQKITATMLVPSMLYALMDHPDSHTRDLSSLETVYYGASAINPVRLKEAIDRFGPIFAQYYGQSEAPMVITYLAKGDHVTGDDAPALVVRPPVGVHPHGAARRGRQPGAGGGARRDLRRRPAARRRLLEPARARPPRPSATAGCTPATWPARTRTASGTSSTAPRT